MLALPTTHCRSCESSDLDQVFDLGEQHLSDFFSSPSLRPPKAKLELWQCNACSLVQLGHTVLRTELYHERYGYASGVNSGIVANLKRIVDAAWADYCNLNPGARLGSWLDIGCNDGTLLSFVPKHVIRVGVDPVKKFAPAARAHANQIISGFFSPTDFGNRFDVITSISMFYDIQRLSSFVGGVASLLDPRGIWVIQQNYLVDMLRQTSFDNICHEHLTYFHLGPLSRLLERHGLEIIGIEKDPINGGCIRTTVAHAGRHPHEPAIQEAIDLEQAAFEPGLWDGFAARTGEICQGICEAVGQAHAASRRVAILGASTRGAVIWQAAGLTAGSVQAALEIQQDKIGRFYSAVDGIPIISQDEIDLFDLLLVGPYWHRQLFISQLGSWMRAGGQLVFPIPSLEVVGLS